MPTLELDPLVDRVRDAIRDADLPKRPQLPSIDEFTKDLRKVDAGAAVDQLAKAIERIDIPKAIERMELPQAIEQRLPGRRKRRGPSGLLRLAVIGGIAVATLALFPPLRRQLRAAVDGLRAQISGFRGDQGSHSAAFPVAFPEAQTMPVQDDPGIPGSPAPYPDGLGNGDAALDGLTLDRPLTETKR